MNLYAPAIFLAAVAVLALGGSVGYAIAPKDPPPGAIEQCLADLDQLVRSQAERERGIAIAVAATMEAVYADRDRRQAQ